MALLLPWACGAGCGGTAPTAATGSKVVQETWDALYVQGTKAGHVHTTVEQLDTSDGPHIRIVSEMSIAAHRFGQQVESTLRQESLETPQGDVLQFRYTSNSGGTSLSTSGRVEDGQVTLRRESGGQAKEWAAPWPAENGGLFAVEQSMRREPLQAGRTRRLQAFIPMLDQTASVQLTAHEVEQTKLFAAAYPLLRIAAVYTLPDGQTLQQELWTDQQGEIRKGRDSVALESIRTTREVALQQDPTAPLDLGLDVLVRVAEPLSDVHERAAASYEVRIEDGDPAEAFASCASQQVHAIDAHTARIEVRQIRPDSPPDLPVDYQPTGGDLAASSLIQTGDPQVRAMAREAAAGAMGAWPVALAAERYVHEQLTKGDFSQVFSSAAEVAESRSGDCTEHAVLLAALLRANDIPARVAIGLVYVPAEEGFLYHMWNEAWIEDRWIPLDGTLGQGGIGAGHLKIRDTDLADDTAYSSLLPVLQLINRLSIRGISEQ
ncbi:MAG: transglutaminase domain-containing protein [Pirellulales bacterium]